MKAGESGKRALLSSALLYGKWFQHRLEGLKGGNVNSVTISVSRTYRYNR